MPCNKIDKPLVVNRFSENLVTSIITLRKRGENIDVFIPDLCTLTYFYAKNVIFKYF